MSAPLIAISAERSDQPSAFGLRQSTIQVMEYAEAVASAGGRPAILPATENIADGILEGFDGLILTGGGDLSPEMYGETSDGRTYGVSYIRDRFETELVAAAELQDLPVLAICRGMQLINVLRGGKLLTHIDDHWQENPSHESHHAINIDPASALASAMGGVNVEVNSYHHQGIATLGDALHVTAQAGEVIEAFEDVTERIIAVQWHPEHMASTSEPHQALFQDIVTRGRSYREKKSEQKGTFTNV